MGKILGYYTMPHPPIMIPEVGKGEEEKIKQTIDACNKVANEISTLNPETIVLVTPHGYMFNDTISISSESNILGNLSKFGAPEVSIDIKINKSIVYKILDISEKLNVASIEVDNKLLSKYGKKLELDHGAIVPLYYVMKKFTNFNLVHITYGLLSEVELYKFGIAIKQAIEESSINAVFIASGDLSHRLSEEGPYKFSSYGKMFDDEIIKLLKIGDVKSIFNMNCDLVENAAECGLKSFFIMLGAMNGYKILGELLSYEGTFGVGYGVMRFDVEKNEEDMILELIDEKIKKDKSTLEKEDIYVKLARESITEFVKNSKCIDVPQYVVDEMKNTKSGVFVSLKKNGNLRGCIGTIFPRTNNIAEEIIRNAIEASIYDPRFMPVKESELPELQISVDVLTKPIESSKDMLDPKKYGVIVRSGMKTGLLLPDLEGVDTVEEQINIALQKAGISPREQYNIEKFQVIRHH